MKQRCAEWIVRRRKIILPVMLVLAAVFTLLIGRTNINYDLNRYLSEETMTKKALGVMEEEFGSSGQLRIMFTDADEAALAERIAVLSELPEVRFASYDPAEDTRVSGGRTYSLVTLTLNDHSPGELVIKLRGLFPDAGEYYVGGPAADSLDLQRRVADEIPLVMGISVIIVIAVLLLTGRAWLEPLVILPVLGISILINMGTNFIFPDVSFITYAVSAILQLALSIDYAIMLLHTWNDACEGGLSAADAMVEALAGCFMRIASSAMTTAAGLLSLLFMSFTIGFDIGLVLTKGILVSMLGVFLMMPAVALLAEKPLRATRHKPIRMGGEKLAAGIDRVKKPLAAALILAVVLGAVLSAGNTYAFTGKNDTGRKGSPAIDEIFGASDPLVLLVPGGDEDSDYEAQRELVRRLNALTLADGRPAIGDITAMVTAGSAALEYYTAQDAAELTGQSLAAVRLFFAMNGFGDTVRADRLLDAAASFAADNGDIAALRKRLSDARTAFIGPHYGRMLLELNFRPSDAGFRDHMDGILDTVRGCYGEDFYITGVAMSSYDIGHAFTGDLMKVNLITLLAILLIVSVSFRAIRLPILLVFVIEGAIWITMGISRLMGESVFFMAYLICLAIQMGATIDYGILLCDQYRSARLSGLEKRPAMAETLKKAMPTILTSGTILITAGFVIGILCTVYYISGIGALLARGALVSVILVLSLLPALLLIADGWITKNLKT